MNYFLVTIVRQKYIVKASNLREAKSKLCEVLSINLEADSNSISGDLLSLSAVDKIKFSLNNTGDVWRTD